MDKQTFPNWLAESGLYKAHTMSTDGAYLLAEIVYRNGIRIDAYCPECADRTTYIAAGRVQAELDKKPFAPRPIYLSKATSDRREAAAILGKALGGLLFACARSSKHALQVYLRIEVGEDATVRFQKIGQFPSVFDQATEKLRRYRAVLSAEDVQELNSALICNSHGFHVAAYTYLRRVFERRIEVAHAAAKADPKWDDAAYSPSAFMEQRIELLRDHLPGFLVEHRKLYNVLSRGIHELEEKDCAEGYDVVHLGVSLILDEEIERKIRSDKIAAASKSLRQLHEKLTS
jgi:hypothetical protein